VFENRVLKKIFGPKRKEVTGERKRLHEQKPQNLHSLLNIIRTGKLKRMRSSRHLARMREKGRGLGWGNLRTGHHLKGLGVYGGIILKWILK